MQIKEMTISTSFGGVISEAPFENVRPGYSDSVTVSLTNEDDEHKIRETYRNLLQTEQIRAFELLKNKFKAELLQTQFQKIRFREKGGINYPSVTSITDWAKDWKISDMDLAQYAARGTIVHKMIEMYIDKQIWPDLKELAMNGLFEEATLLVKGSLKLDIEACSFKKFFEAHGKDFEFDETEKTIFNEKHLYCGRLDAVGRYQGRKAIIDFKTGSSWDFRQLAAYANGDEINDIEVLVVCPVGPTDNKSGVMKPSVSTNVNTEFEGFLKARADFKQRFGI